MWKKHCFQVLITSWYLLLATKISDALQRSCSVSLPTLQLVSMCPTTEEELEKATKRKDCKSLAEIQKCVLPRNFTYHCVINDLKNEIYEVCAPEIHSQDRSCSKLVKHREDLTGNYSWNYLSTILAAISGVLFLLVSLLSGILLRKMKQKNYGESTKILNGEESTANAIQKITDDYDSRQRRKGKEQISQRTKLLTTSTLSIKSCESHVTVKQGFDAKTFNFFLKRHNLQDCKKVLFKNKIDCLQTFFELDEEKLTSLGLDYGQVLKCLRAKKTIQTESSV
ncbi:uncharacterized protein LOC134262399 isoform X2 [Saccostrea cucullata]|uniref:uncharacterized protein LOC134262399 isoform X2 n=1 Tax=Saccostrea cuccullata TaxID=36930 RepID=UPI002ED4EBD7